MTNQGSLYHWINNKNLEKALKSGIFKKGYVTEDQPYAEGCSFHLAQEEGKAFVVEFDENIRGMLKEVSYPAIIFDPICNRFRRASTFKMIEEIPAQYIKDIVRYIK